MKLIHTSDWHLGQNFMFRQRIEEHRRFLSWLEETLIHTNADLLLVTGDIFDTASPPSYALKMYYKFLAGLKNTPCQTVIIISGNHDSASVLNAPKQILRELNVHVIASATDPVTDEIIRVKDKNGKTTAYVCAVPFLRDQDLRKSLPGESWEEKNKAVIKGLQSHYQLVGDAARSLMDDESNPHLPLIATGHLFATGGIIGDDDHIRQIHLGNLGRFNVGHLSDRFDYVALGHLHRCQKVSQLNHIRYSGSPIPLSFGEAAYPKYLLSVDFESDDPLIEKIKIPQFQPMITIKGPLETILEQLEYLGHEEPSESWAEIIISGKWDPMMEDTIRKKAEGFNIQIFALKKETRHQPSTAGGDKRIKDLDHFSCREIFIQRLEKEEGLTSDQKDELLHAFDEIEQLSRQDTEDHRID